MIRRAFLAAGLAFATIVVTAAPAAAHGGNVLATDYRPRITSAPIPGVDVRIIEGGGRVELTDHGNQDVTVLGYEGEPYLRVGPDGVFRNRRSPAVAINSSLRSTKAPPADADPSAPPEWVRIGSGRTTRWHDHRLHWMQPSPPPGGRIAWELPLRLGTAPASVRGEIVYVPGPSSLPWMVVAAAVAAGVLLLGRRALVAALAVVVAADVVRVAALTFAVADHRLTQLANVGVLDIVGWGLAVVAVVRLAQRRPDGELAAGLAGLLLGLTGGVLDWGDLAKSQLVVSVPAPVVRACIALIAGGGLGVAAVVLRAATRPASARGRRAARPAP